MDLQGVPKKVHRHVLKAIRILNDADNESSITTEEIITEVTYSMRNLVPMKNLDECICESLNVYCENGLLEREENNESFKIMPEALAAIPVPSVVDLGPIVFKPFVERKKTPARPKINEKRSVQLSQHNYNLRSKSIDTQDSVQRKTEPPRLLSLVLPAMVNLPMSSDTSFYEEYTPNTSSTSSRRTSSASEASTSNGDNNVIKSPGQCAQQ